jgi:hypothetical protein
MSVQDELAEKERAAWRAFMDAVDRLPPERFDERSVVPGWSAKDLVWHNVGWARFAADELAARDGRPFTDPFDEHDDAHWDELSDRILQEGRELAPDEIRTKADKVRARTLQTLLGLSDLSPEAATFFAEESLIHYEEHRLEVERFLGG